MGVGCCEAWWPGRLTPNSFTLEIILPLNAARHTALIIADWSRKESRPYDDKSIWDLIRAMRNMVRVLQPQLPKRLNVMLK